MVCATNTSLDSPGWQAAGSRRFGGPSESDVTIPTLNGPVCVDANRTRADVHPCFTTIRPIVESVGDCFEARRRALRACPVVLTACLRDRIMTHSVGFRTEIVPTVHHEAPASHSCIPVSRPLRSSSSAHRFVLVAPYLHVGESIVTSAIGRTNRFPQIAASMHPYRTRVLAHPHR